MQNLVNILNNIDSGAI